MKPLIYFAALLLCISACTSPRKALRRANAYALDNPAWLAEKCAEGFKSDTIRIPGQTITRTDTVTQQLTADCPDGTTVTVTVPKYIERNHYRVDTIQTDKPATLAALKHMTNQRDKLVIDTAALKERVRQLQAENKEQNRAIWILSAVLFGVVVVGVVWVVRRR